MSLLGLQGRQGEAEAFGRDARDQRVEVFDRSGDLLRRGGAERKAELGKPQAAAEKVQLDLWVVNQLQVLQCAANPAHAFAQIPLAKSVRADRRAQELEALLLRLGALGQADLRGGWLGFGWG